MRMTAEVVRNSPETLSEGAYTSSMASGFGVSFAFFLNLLATPPVRTIPRDTKQWQSSPLSQGFPIVTGRQGYQSLQKTVCLAKMMGELMPSQ